MLAELRPLAAGERDVGREVVAAALAVQLGEQQRLVAADLGRDAVLDEGAREPHRQARRERVGAPVAVVVGRVEALPRRPGQHDEHVARLPAGDDDRAPRSGACACAPRRGTGPTCRPGRRSARRASACRCRGCGSRGRRSRRSCQAKRSPTDSTATAARLARLDRARRRLRAQVAHGDAAAAGQRAAVLEARRDRRRGADVAGLVAAADDDGVRARRDAPAAARCRPTSSSSRRRRA